MSKKYLDDNGLLYLWQKITNLFVKKDGEKVLSTNDYTTADKTKLNGIAIGAQVNKIESIKVNGTAQAISSKAVNITVPTNNNSLTNGAGYQNATQVQSLINSALANVTGIDFQIVSSLPSSGVKGTIYLVANGKTGSDVYDEWIWVNNKFEHIGSTSVDLSNYLKVSDIIAITNAEIDTIVAS